MRIRRPRFFDLLPGIVGGTVADKDKLIGDPALFHNIAEAPGTAADHQLFVVGGNHN